MKRLIIDVSSVCWMSLLVGKDQEYGREVELDGKAHWVNGWQFGYECAVNHLTSVMKQYDLVPKDLIFVVEGQDSKAKRESILPQYKMSRGKRPKEAYEQFNLLKAELVRVFRILGAHAVRADGVEADDVIGHLVQKLEGKKIILSNDGDLAVLLGPDVICHRNGQTITENPYGPFPAKYITVYKALVGDPSDSIPGARGFGEKSFLDFLVYGGDGGLPALEGMIQRKTLTELVDDVADFKPLQKILNDLPNVYACYEVAKLHPEWVGGLKDPLKIFSPIKDDEVKDSRLNFPKVTGYQLRDELEEPIKPVAAASTTDYTVKKNHAVFDCELIGSENPVFLTCIKVLETGERASFWHQVEGDMDRMNTFFQRDDLCFVSFNGLHFDQPLISAAICGKDTKTLKNMAQALIDGSVSSWNMSDEYGYETVKFDHIDLIEVAPGVRVSLKTYAGRMGYPTMVDLPFHHDMDLTNEQCDVLESYCQNDLGVTEALFNKLVKQIDLRRQLSNQYAIDLRSKSDAQIAETVLRKAVGIKKQDATIPPFVVYQAPAFIKTDSVIINTLVKRMGEHRFTINQANGSPDVPDFLSDPVQLGYGTYQMGNGGLHSTHDKKLYVEAKDGMLISDWDVASYYPTIMIESGFVPLLDGKGDKFIDEYKKIYERRLQAKRDGDKTTADSLKIFLNGTFGKLGSMYSSFYAPDLMLAITLTGQLNLMCLIHELEKLEGVKVLSANTDGIMVHYPASQRQAAIDVVSANSKATGFEYEETPYSKIALKDVNNYVVVTAEGEAAITKPDGTVELHTAKGGKAKRKGLYAEKGLNKNPTMQVCSDMVVDYLVNDVPPHRAIRKHTDIEDYVAIRNVKGGGIQYESFIEVDDWELVKDLGTKDNEWVRKAVPGRVVKRKSRPHPVEVGQGGVPFGRIARWYMTTQHSTGIHYTGSGNKVPKTDGAKLCMTLPSELPGDLDKAWYVSEALSILEDLGVAV